MACSISRKKTVETTSTPFTFFILKEGKVYSYSDKSDLIKATEKFK